MGLIGGLVWELVGVSVGYLFFWFVIGPFWGVHWEIPFVGVLLEVRLWSLGASIIGSFAVSIWGFINTSYLTDLYIFLPSSWNLDKIFALTGELGPVHMAKKIFPIFLYSGRWIFLLLNL